ncbi:MAG: polyphosphate kinase [Proteobacteria bacterium]|nr:polyphosphate kinase [Pseudomonadota bacterium]
MSKRFRLDRIKPLKPFKDKDAYQKALGKVQKRLLVIQQAYLLQGRRAMIVFEGTDAAGKGGTIRRLTERLDPRFCKVWPTGAPNQTEKRQHYLQRFWARVPDAGSSAVFDRSWYGRVLVERAEKLISRREWKRAYGEINEFERLLTDDGVVLLKFYLHIVPETQKRRFIERLTDPLKRWKITRRDFEVRKYHDAYRDAVEEALTRTSTDHAPWHIIDAEYKWAAHVKIFTIIADTLAKGVDLDPPNIDDDLRRLAKQTLGVEV